MSLIVRSSSLDQQCIGCLMHSIATSRNTPTQGDDFSCPTSPRLVRSAHQLPIHPHFGFCVTEAKLLQAKPSGPMAALTPHGIRPSPISLLEIHRKPHPGTIAVRRSGYSEGLSHFPAHPAWPLVGGIAGLWTRREAHRGRRMVRRGLLVLGRWSGEVEGWEWDTPRLLLKWVRGGCMIGGRLGTSVRGGKCEGRSVERRVGRTLRVMGHGSSRSRGGRSHAIAIVSQLK